MVRASNILPEIRVAFFKCSRCGFFVTQESSKGKIKEPESCPRADCNSKNSMNLIHNRSIFTDKQLLKLQETPENIPAGQTPHAITLCLYDQMIDTLRPGDK